MGMSGTPSFGWNELWLDVKLASFLFTALMRQSVERQRPRFGLCIRTQSTSPVETKAVFASTALVERNKMRNTGV